MSSTNFTTYFTTFYLSTATTKGAEQNPFYPKRKLIQNVEEFRRATNYDHTVGRFDGNKRSKKGFISCDVIAMDIDNDDKINPHLWNDPRGWMTLDIFKKHFLDYDFLISTSKSHLKEKSGREKRPRFHAYFPLGHEITSVEEYEKTVQYLIHLYVRDDDVPIFDTNATDCARFYYGKSGAHIYHNRGKSILEWIAERKDKVDKEVNNLVVASATTETSSSKSEEANRNRFIKGWKYKNIIKKYKVEDFYGSLETENETKEYWKVRCTTGRHEDKHASLQIDKVTFSWKCWAGCGKGNVFDFIALREEKTKDEVIAECCEELGIVNKDKRVQVEVLDAVNETSLVEETPEDKAVKELNKKHAVITVKGRVRIMVWGTTKMFVNEREVEYPELDFMRVDDLQTKYMNQRIDVGGDRTVSKAQVFLMNSKRREYEGLEFDPGATSPSKEKWNMWEDWETGELGFDRFIDKKVYDSISKEDAPHRCEKYIQLIKEVICGKYNEEEQSKLLKYILYWMADAINNPRRRTGTAIALQGGQGTGKTTFVSLFGELFGKFYIHLTDSARLTGKFNWLFKDNLLTYSDEAFWAGKKSDEGLIKGLITEPTRTLEPKFIDAGEVPNYSRVILSSNENWVIPDDWDGRRWIVVEVSNKHANDRKYFGELREEWRNGGKEAFLKVLREIIPEDLDFPSYDFQNERIITTAHWAQRIQSNKTAMWWVNILEKGYFEYKDDDGNTQRLNLSDNEINDFFQTDKIHDDFLTFNKKQGDTRYLPYPQQFSAQLGKLGITFDNNVGRKYIGENKRTIWRFGSLNTLREEWEIKTGDKRWSEQKEIGAPDVMEILTHNKEEEDNIDEGKEAFLEDIGIRHLIEKRKNRI